MLTLVEDLCNLYEGEAAPEGGVVPTGAGLRGTVLKRIIKAVAGLTRAVAAEGAPEGAVC